MYEQRFYRDFGKTDRWAAYRVRVESSDLYIRSRDNHALWVQSLVRNIRHELKDHIRRRPEFLESMAPLEPTRRAHPMIARMYRAALRANTGPMAAVAGAVAELVGRELLRRCEEVVVENGGDTFLKLSEQGVSTIFAGKSPFSGAIGLRIDPEKTPLAVCTSSGTVGPSVSLGRADAATIVSRDACLADAVATATANRVRSKEDLEDALGYALGIEGVLGAVLILGDELAVQGDVELVRTA
jgi:hypothetical protein